MNRIPNLLLTTIIICLLVSCRNEMKLIEADIQIEAPALHLEKTCKFNYNMVLDSVKAIVLENDTTAGMIGSIIKDIHIDDEYLFISDNNFVHMYLIDGAFVRNIGNKGRGRGEYLKIGGFDINKTKQEVTIYDEGSSRFLIYGYDGSFIRTFDMNIAIRDFISLKNGDYLIYKPDYDGEDSERGLWQISERGVIKKRLLTFDNSFNACFLGEKMLFRLDEDTVVVKGLEKTNLIYHVTTDTIINAYHINTDLPYDKRFAQKGYHTDSERDKMRYYTLNSVFETSRHFEFMITDTKKHQVTVIMDKNNNSIYRVYDENDIVFNDPEDIPITFVCENSKIIYFIYPFPIINTPEYKTKYPFVTPDSNPLIFIRTAKR